jgi:hypothetical protein
MNISDFKKSIRDGFNAIFQLQLTAYDRVVTFSNLEPPDSFRKIAFKQDVYYEEIYRTGLRERVYNFSLEDNSYFQFWHDQNQSPRRLRYAFYPNPFDASELLETDNDDSYTGIEIELHSQELEEAPIRIGVPAVRYDLSLDDHKPTEHPASHLTVGIGCDNRWPIARILTPKLFCLLICRHFYPEVWDQHRLAKPTLAGFVNDFDEKLATEKRLSTLLSSAHFTNLERQLIFLD